MKKILYFLFCLLAANQLTAQNCSFNVSNNALGVYNFTSTVTLPNGPFFYSWSFGDGTSSTQANPIHTFAPGTFTVCMTATDTIGNSCTFCDSLIVTPPSNNCYYSFTPNAANPSNISFTGVPAYSNSAVYWDFGDGSALSYGPFQTHTYQVSGTFTACMFEYDSMTQAILCQNCQGIQIGAQQICSFLSRPDSLNPNDIQFIASPSSSIGTFITWNYGDGSSGTGVVSNHVYVNPGVFNVCMEERDSANNLVCSDCSPVSINGNPFLCNFQYSASPSGVVVFSAPNNVGFYTWYSGTGITLTGNPVTITYAPGVVTDSVCLVITDALGNVLCTYCDIINLNSTTNPCQADFASASLGLDAYFIDLSHTYTAATTFSWGFGDGTGSSLRFPQHTYANPGFYTVCLNIQDGNCQDSYCQTIYIDSVITLPTNCDARFVVTQTGPYQLAVVNLSNGLNLSYAWDFGDGATSNLRYPSHTYSTTGSYNLCLTVSDSTGCSDTFCDTLSVDSAGNIIYRSTSTGFSINVVSPDQMTTGVDQIAKDITSAIYPNPATSSIRVQTTDLRGTVNYRVLSIQGSESLKGTMNSADETIRLDNLTPGMYMLEMTDASQNRIFGRFIKN